MRKSRTMISLLACFLLASGIAAPTTSWAQEEGISLENQSKRMNLLRKADKASRRGKYNIALDHLQQALKLTPIPDINDHYNIIVLAAALKRCTEVVLHAHAFELLAKDDPGFEEVTTHRDACLGEEAKTGQISVFDIPEKARVLLNGVLVGDGELSRTSLIVGTYKLEVKALEYKRHREKIVLKENEHEKRSITLIKRTYFGMLVIRTIPPGASIRIEGKANGTSPLGPIKLTTGKHFVELRLDGYDRFIRNVKIQRDQTTDFEANLEKASNNQ
jgi:hypothetical protein